jgi:DNA-damage-inducible protein J
MAISNVNVRTDSAIKKQAEEIFTDLGLNMTTAVNLFLRATIRENGLPFDLKLDVPNAETAAAIEEGRRIADDPNERGYNSIDELRKALEE